MTDGPGRFATAHDFSIVHSFFASDPATLRAHKNVQPNDDAIFTEEEFRNYIGGASAIISQSQSFLNSASGDFAERVYVWETVGFEIDDRARFVVTPAGELEIRYFAIIPFTSSGHEDFDFSGGWTANLGAYFLEDWVDPSRIGRTVDIFFSDTRTTTTFTQTDYDAGDQSLDEDITNFPAALPAIVGLTNDLFDNGTIKFEYDGKALVYGTYGGGVVNIEDKINSDHEDLAENGIVFVGSAQADIVNTTDVSSMLLGNEGADTINGGDGNDEIYGGTVSGEDDGAADTLVGGSGNDTYYVGAGDIVTEATDGGTDLVLSSVTYALANESNVENLTLIGTAAINGTGNDEDNIVIGNAAANEIIGGAGKDLILGGQGNGSDTLRGGSGEDVLIGGDGDDVIYADENDERDIVDGGVGADKFYVGSSDIIVNLEADDLVYVNGVLVTGQVISAPWTEQGDFFVGTGGVSFSRILEGTFTGEGHYGPGDRYSLGTWQNAGLALTADDVDVPILVFGVDYEYNPERHQLTASGEEEGAWFGDEMVAEGGLLDFLDWQQVDHHIPEFDPIPQFSGDAGQPISVSDDDLVETATLLMQLGYDQETHTWNETTLLSAWAA
jgi:hypothetical protein